METSEFLARRHQEVVSEFIESVLDELDLGDPERNVVGATIRREVETGLVPGLVAVQAVFHAADAVVLGRDLSGWLDRVSAVMPGESKFFTDMGRCVDPDGASLLDENLGLLPGKSEGRRGFEAHVWEMSPFVSRLPFPQ